MLIAFQGEHGAYSEAGIFEHFGAQVDSLPCESFDMVFASVASGAAEMGFIPIENSLAGSIHRNYDLLVQHTLAIIGEHHLRVSHCLIGHPGVTLSEVRKVISHPQALAQCDNCLRRLGVATEVVYDTAGSVKMVRESGDYSCMLFDAKGRFLSQGTASVPSFTGTGPATLSGMLAHIPADTLADGRWTERPAPRPGLRRRP